MEDNMNLDAVARFENEETRSIPCGNSPGVLLSEIFQARSIAVGTNPFAVCTAHINDLRTAGDISSLSRKVDDGGCMIHLGKRTCHVNGHYYPIPDTAYIQLRVENPDICYSLLVNAADTFAAAVFDNDFTDDCFMLAKVADMGWIYVPLNGFRLLSVWKEKKHREYIGLIVECEKKPCTGIHGSIIREAALLDRVRKTFKDGYLYRQI